MPPNNRPNKPKAGFPAFWLSRTITACLLWPISQVFIVLAFLRRIFTVSQHLPVPVIVVGGITVGGAGKTPLAIWLVDALRRHGYMPGIISRGYGGAVSGVAEVTKDSNPAVTGDEPVLLRHRADCPVFVGANRIDAGKALLEAYPLVNVIICDDGLQHYRLARDVEIVVLDRRGIGNGWCLPAGPLREMPARLKKVDAVVLNGTSFNTDAPASFSMALQGNVFTHLHDPARTMMVSGLQGKPLHAVAGIGSPQRFFDHLQQLGLSVEAHAFPDHHAYSSSDVQFGNGNDEQILTTEKDAVKLRAILPPDAAVWVLPVTAHLSAGLDQLIVEKLNGRASA